MAFMYIRYICLFSFVHFTFFHVFHWCLSVSSLSFVFVSRSTFLTVKTKRYDLLARSEGVLRFLIWHYSHTLSTTIWNFMQLFHHHLLNQAIWLELVLVLYCVWLTTQCTEVIWKSWKCLFSFFFCHEIMLHTVQHLNLSDTWWQTWYYVPDKSSISVQTSRCVSMKHKLI